MESSAWQWRKVPAGSAVSALLKVTFFSLSHDSNSFSPMVDTLAGKVKERRAVALKAELPILLTFSPSEISSSLLLPLSRLSGISVTEGPNEIFFRLAKPEATLMMAGAVLSTVTSYTLSHSAKAFSATSASCLFSVMLFRLSQL